MFFSSYFIQPPSDSFEMEDLDYDSTEDPVWKREKDEVGFISLQSYALISRIDQQ